MASGVKLKPSHLPSGPSAPPSSFFLRRSWADIAGNKTVRAEGSPVVQGAALEKLETLVTYFFKINDEARLRAEERFSNALYRKFLCRPPTLDTVRSVLLDRWKEWVRSLLLTYPMVDLTQPLRIGFWISNDDWRVFIVVQYECLPTFCYQCGIIGHKESSCLIRHSSILNQTVKTASRTKVVSQQQEGHKDQMKVMMED